MRSLTPFLGGLVTTFAIDPFWAQSFSALTLLVGTVITVILTNRTSKRAAAEAQTAAVKAKTAETKATSASDRVAAIEAVLQTHQSWDQEVHAAVLRIDPAFPPPPPLTLPGDPTA